MQDRLIQLWRARPRLIVGSALGGVAVIALGAFALSGGHGGATTSPNGPALDIAVVAPTEPDIQPGERMEVGALVNDFDGQTPKADTNSVDAPADGYDSMEPAYVGDGYERPSAPPGDRPHGKAGNDDWGEVRGRGDRLGLGFDGSRPESGAEREARVGPVQPRQSGPRPSGDPAATFY